MSVTPVFRPPCCPLPKDSQSRRFYSNLKPTTRPSHPPFPGTGLLTSGTNITTFCAYGKPGRVGKNCSRPTLVTTHTRTHVGRYIHYWSTYYGIKLTCFSQFLVKVRRPRGSETEGHRFAP